MNKNLLLLAFISELYFLLAAIGLVYDDLKVLIREDSFLSTITSIVFGLSLVFLRFLTFYVIIVLFFHESVIVRIAINIIWIVYCYRFYLSIRKVKRDFGFIDSVICIICFLFLIRVL